MEKSQKKLGIIAGGTNDYGNEKTVELGNINDKQDVSFFGGLFVLFTKVKEKYNNSVKNIVEAKLLLLSNKLSTEGK